MRDRLAGLPASFCCLSLWCCCCCFLYFFFSLVVVVVVVGLVVHCCQIVVGQLLVVCNRCASRVVQVWLVAWLLEERGVGVV